MSSEDVWDDEDTIYYAERREEDEGPRELFGCVFPARCLMPGLHTRDECHTAEMVEASLDITILGRGEALELDAADRCEDCGRDVCEHGRCVGMECEGCEVEG